MATVATVEAVRIRNQIHSALSRSAAAGLWQKVMREAEWEFAVPSTSREGLWHTVVVRPRRFAGEPAWACYSCSCEAWRRAACIHRAAVYQWLYRRRFGALPTGLASMQPVQPVQPAAPAPAAQEVSRVA